jgi:hypothetical protein
MSTREAENHVKSQKPKGEVELALEGLIRALKRCEEINPEKALAGLVRSDDRALLVGRIKRAARVLLNLYAGARNAAAQSN